jgi:hypothetical protein
VTLAPGIAAALTKPGRALIGFCDWVESDFSAGRLRRLLQSGDLRVGGQDAGLSAGQAARLLAQVEAAWGRATYGIALTRLQKSLESRAADADATGEDRADAQLKVEQAALVRAWISRLVALVPEPAMDGKVSLQTMVSGVMGFIEGTTARSSALEHRAAAALQDYIGELRALGPFECELSQSLRFIRERVESLCVAPERPRPGHLYVCNLAQSGYAGAEPFLPSEYAVDPPLLFGLCSTPGVLDRHVRNPYV